MLVFCSPQIGWCRYQLVPDSLQKLLLVGINQRMSEQRHEVICHDNEIPTCFSRSKVICHKIIDGEIILQFLYPKSVIRKSFLSFSNDRFGIIIFYFLYSFIVRHTSCIWADEEMVGVCDLLFTTIDFCDTLVLT